MREFFRTNAAPVAKAEFTQHIRSTPSTVASKLAQDSAASPKSRPVVTASWFAARKRNSQLYLEDWCSILLLTSSRLKFREAFSKPSVRIAKMTPSGRSDSAMDANLRPRSSMPTQMAS